MKIDFDFIDKPVTFDSITPGDVFITGGVLYMKIESVVQIGKNAVDLQDGSLVSFYKTDKVLYQKNAVLKRN